MSEQTDPARPASVDPVPPADVQPKRIQRKRTKGWTMPANAMYVGRPTKWGNPFSFEQRHDYTRLSCVAAYRRFVTGNLTNGTGYPLQELRGKDLACWCPLDQPCHADVLLELAND